MHFRIWLLIMVFRLCICGPGHVSDERKNIWGHLSMKDVLKTHIRKMEGPLHASALHKQTNTSTHTPTHTQVYQKYHYSSSIMPGNFVCDADDNGVKTEKQQTDKPYLWKLFSLWWNPWTLLFQGSKILTLDALLLISIFRHIDHTFHNKEFSSYVLGYSRSNILIIFV